MTQNVVRWASILVNLRRGVDDLPVPLEQNVTERGEQYVYRRGDQNDEPKMFGPCSGPNEHRDERYRKDQ